MNNHTAASAPIRRVAGRSNNTAVATSATPLIYVQNSGLGGSHGGTMSLKNEGLVKCEIPAKPRNRARILARRFGFIRRFLKGRTAKQRRRMVMEATR